MKVGSRTRTSRAGHGAGPSTHSLASQVPTAPATGDRPLRQPLNPIVRASVNCAGFSPPVGAASWRDPNRAGWGPAMSDEPLVQRSQPAARRARCFEPALPLETTRNVSSG